MKNCGLLVALSLFLTASGCSGGSSPSDLAVSDLAVLDDLSAPPDLTVTLTLLLATFELNGPRIAGTTICLYPSKTTCVVTEAGGAVALKVATNADIALSLDNPGYQPLLATLHTSGTSSKNLGYILNPTAAMQSKATAGGFTLDPTKAILEAQVGLLVGPGAPTGITMTVSPSAGKPVVYLDATHTPAPLLTGTSTDGTGWFPEVPPGDYEVAFNDTNGACTNSMFGWKGATPGTVRLQAVAGYLVNGGVSCP